MIERIYSYHEIKRLYPDINLESLKEDYFSIFSSSSNPKSALIFPLKLDKDKPIRVIIQEE